MDVPDPAARLRTRPLSEIEAEEAALSAAARERLEALGYLDADDAPAKAVEY